MTTFFSTAVRDWLLWKSQGTFKGKRVLSMYIYHTTRVMVYRRAMARVTKAMGVAECHPSTTRILIHQLRNYFYLLLTLSGFPFAVFLNLNILHLKQDDCPFSVHVVQARITCCWIPTARSRAHRATQHPPPLTRVVFPDLTSLHFCGDIEYLENILSQMETPMSHERHLMSSVRGSPCVSVERN